MLLADACSIDHVLHRFHSALAGTSWTYTKPRVTRVVMGIPGPTGPASWSFLLTFGSALEVKVLWRA